ncbi:MAG: hypothetical protein ACMUIA_02435 [bacterium]
MIRLLWPIIGRKRKKAVTIQVWLLKRKQARDLASFRGIDGTSAFEAFDLGVVRTGLTAKEAGGERLAEVSKVGEQNSKSRSGLGCSLTCCTSLRPGAMCGQ